MCAWSAVRTEATKRYEIDATKPVNRRYCSMPRGNG